MENPKINKYSRSTLSCSLGALFLVCTAGTCYGEDTYQSAELDLKKKKNALLEEVVVTAQRRAEDASDVSISMAKFSEEQLAVLGVTEVNDLAIVVPGLQLGEVGGNPVVFLRGVGTDAFLQADPSVSYIIDEIYQPFTFGGNQKFGVIERVEVLKGPQGTLFGRNSIGGAIHVITRKPNLEEFEFNVEGEVGDYESKGVSTYTSLPFIPDKSALAVSYYKNSRDSYYSGRRGVTPFNPDGVPLLKERSKGYQFRLFISPNEDLDIDITYNKSEKEGMGSMMATNPNPSLLGQALLIEANDGYDNVSVNTLTFMDSWAELFSAKLRFYFDWFDIVAIASKQKKEGTGSHDFDGSSQPIADFTIDPVFADVHMLELQLQSSDSSWGAERFSWTTGIFFYNGIQGIEGGYLTATDQSIFDGGGSIEFQTQVNNLLAQLGSPVLVPGGSVKFYSQEGTRSIAAYGLATYDITNWLAIKVGGRYMDETKWIDESGSSLANPDGSNGPELIDAKTGKRPVTTKNFGPEVTIEFRPIDNLLTFASFKKTKKAEVYNNTNIIADNAIRVGPTSMEAYEIGLKGDWFDRALQIEASAFYYKQEKLAIQFISLRSGGALELEEAQSAYTKGAEFSMTAAILPAIVDNFVLTASLSYLDAKYDKYNPCLGYDEDTGQFREDLDCSGKQMPRSPKWSGRIGLNKSYYLSTNLSLELGADIFWSDRYYTTSNNHPDYGQSQYKVANAHSTLLYKNISITPFVRNITNEKYAAGIIGNDFGATVSLAAPRTYGVRAKYEF